jgi:hypothetical protein
MELAAAGENMMALREIAKVHIAKCKEGETCGRSRNWATGWMAGRRRFLDLSDPDSNPTITKIVHEFVHVTEPPADLSIDDDRDEPLLIEWRKVRDGNGSGGPNS